MEALISASPSDEDGATREDVVKTEIEDKDNDNMTIPQVVNRLGMVFFLLIFNLGITIFVFLLTAMMIFSQILFIIFAMFLPVSFLLSMIPSYEGMAKQAVVKVFNTIMTRAGITLIVTVAFSISSMFYNMSDNYPFFMVAFLQIVTFAGIYFKLGDIMSMFSLNAGDSQTMGRRIFRRPYLFMRHRARRIERKMARAVGAGSMAGSTAGTVASSLFSGGGSARKPTQNKEQRNNTASGSLGSRAGAKAGAVMDTKNRVKDKAKEVKEAVKDMPTQAGYAVYSAKENAKKTVSDFKRGVTQEQETRQSGRTDKLNQRRQSMAQKRMEMQKAQEARHSQKKADGSATTEATRQHERPAVMPKSEAKTIPKPEDKKRPAVATPTTTTGKETPVKERPATSGASVKTPEQRQSIQRQTVKASDTPKPATTQETRQHIQTERTVNTQRTRQVQKSQNNQKTQQTSQKKTTPHKKKGRRK